MPPLPGHPGMANVKKTLIQDDFGISYSGNAYSTFLELEEAHIIADQMEKIHNINLFKIVVIFSPAL